MHSCQSRCVLIQFRYTMGEHRRSIVICFPIDWATANGHYDLVLSPRCSTGGRSEVHEGISGSSLVFRALPFCMLPLGEGRFRPACVFRLDLLETTIIPSDCSKLVFIITSDFRRLDRQMKLMKQLISRNIVDVRKIIIVGNHEGRSVVHTAVIDNAHSNLIELMMSVKSINLNIRDIDGMLPLNLLSQRPRSASSEILIKQLISAGGISNSKDNTERSAIVSQMKMQGLGSSPGTSFRISDAEIFLLKC
ncbi:hypothetical protein J5N97_012993 [Dioscorea zingiberensis]|uniref:Uncharacterized protein n=1 Tax=Dioscorea zingiberensis TaxID=325984 RepID=A0A9D5CRD9_9LILI|nr:hypothetical protein J5N97_012993 [Dioscorea zingiberensis]